METNKNTNISENTLMRIKQLDAIQLEAKNLFCKKNNDYGDAFATYGPVGVLVRIGDKIQRLQNINKKGITLINDENLRDTLIDLHNYAAMSIMLIDEDETRQQEDEDGPCEPLAHLSQLPVAVDGPKYPCGKISNVELGESIRSSRARLQTLNPPELDSRWIDKSVPEMGWVGSRRGVN